MQEPLQVGVLGAGGRMGRTVCSAVAGDAELKLVGAIDPHHVGEEIESTKVVGSLESAGHLDAVVDFTVADAARENIRWCARNSIHCIVGTTGLTELDLAEFRRLFESSPANCLIAPNFAIGAVLMMRFAELAAPWFETAEIIEMHHDRKVDAPSGTALRTAERMEDASKEWSPDPTKDQIEGARGAKPGAIPIHSVRLRGLVAHQEVLLGSEGQGLTIRHDSYDRRSFMPGVILALKSVGSLPGLTVGLDPVLGL